MSPLPGNLTPPHPCPHTQALVCSLQERASGILLCHSPTTGQHSWKWVAQILAGYLKKDGVSQADSILCWFAHSSAEHPLGSSGKGASGRREKACPDEDANEQAYSSQAEATKNHPCPQPVEGVPSFAARLYHGARGPDSFRFNGLGPAARITCACIGNRNSGKVIGWGTRGAGTSLSLSTLSSSLRVGLVHLGKLPYGVWSQLLGVGSTCLVHLALGLSQVTSPTNSLKVLRTSILWPTGPESLHWYVVTEKKE